MTTAAEPGKDDHYGSWSAPPARPPYGCGFPAQGPYGYGPPPGTTSTNRLAIASMVLGISGSIGWAVCWPSCSDTSP